MAFDPNMYFRLINIDSKSDSLPMSALITVDMNVGGNYDDIARDWAAEKKLPVGTHRYAMLHLSAPEGRIICVKQITITVKAPTTQVVTAKIGA